MRVACVRACVGYRSVRAAWDRFIGFHPSTEVANRAKIGYFRGIHSFIDSFIHRTVDIRSGRDVIDDAHAVANDDDDFDAFDARVCGCG